MVQLSARKVRFEHVKDAGVEMVWDEMLQAWKILVDGREVHCLPSSADKPPEESWPSCVEGAPIARMREGPMPPTSPGKFVPVRGFCYALLDSRAERGMSGPSLLQRFNLVQNTVAHRHLSTMFGAERGSDERYDCRTWLEDILSRLAKIEDPSFSGPPDIPKAQIGIAQRLHSAVVLGTSEDIAHFREQGRLTVIAHAVRSLFLEILPQCLVKFPWAHWWVEQRLFFQFFLVGSFGVHKLQQTFQEFAAPSEFESHASCIRNVAADIDWHRVLWMSMPEDDQLVLLLDDMSTIVIKRAGRAVVMHGPWEGSQVSSMVWELFAKVAQMYAWKGKPSNCFSLSRTDYDVALALLGKLPPDQLDNMQQDIFKAAAAWKNLEYAAWNKVTERPQQPTSFSSDDLGVKINIKDAPRCMDGEKPRLSFVFLGEKDTGKSSIAGQLICGTESSARAEDGTRFASLARKYNLEGNEWAWVMDRLREEREKSSTITAKSWNIRTDSFELDMCDAPGEKSYLANLMHGTACKDAAVFVVSARPGEFERGIARGNAKLGEMSGMTFEEPHLANAMGISDLIIVVNKMDHETVQWSQSRFEEVKDQVRHILKRDKRYLEDSCFIPAAGFQGHNICERFVDERSDWYDGFTFRGRRGFTLLEALDALPAKSRQVEAPICMPIDEVITDVRGAGTIIVGTLLRGEVKIGSALRISGWGNHFDTVVKSMECYHVKVASAKAGDKVAIAIRNPNSVNSIKRGMVACPKSGEGCLDPTRTFEANLEILSGPGISADLKVGFTAQLCCHSGRFTVRVARLLWKMGKETGGQKMDDPHSLKPKEIAAAILQFECGQAISTFVEQPELGRFVILGR